MKITVMTADEQIISLDVDRDESVENVKALLEVETRVPLQQQQLLFNGQEMRNNEKLSALGVKDEDLVMMVSNAAPSSSTNALSLNPDGSAVNPEALQQHFRRESNTMAQLFQTDPEFAQALLGNDLNKLQEILRQRHRHRSEIQRQRDEELALLYADPFDVEAQKKIEAAIQQEWHLKWLRSLRTPSMIEPLRPGSSGKGMGRVCGRFQKGIDENWAAALEYNPEAFARVVMLYVDMEVNGVPLKAFVDSGAQSTIISKSCAERCGLLRLLDRRYRGIAHGVGQSEILGRIHVAPIKIGNIFYPCSFMVLDSPNMEFLFGLDMLRKHQCIIDLKDNVLRVGGGRFQCHFCKKEIIEVFFLFPEKDIPSHFLDEERYSKQASSSGGPAASGAKDKNDNPLAGVQSVGSGGGGALAQGTEFEAKVTKLVELGFERGAVIQALGLFNGNEEQAAGFLFGG
ncbi:DNA damage-inducible protein 1 [Vitis vinifera]|uniref:DNA damage-inducible protein 1 n=1 Tax=Vitis vinifera TaxID=29760 RepID=A0A438ER68_VITVI|nr:DNA damage-inducible protein 1 [Vitis vinifera]